MIYICKYCGKSCINPNSLRNHERLCKKNPNHQENPMQGVEPWNKKFLTKEQRKEQKNERWRFRKCRKKEENFIPYKCERCGVVVNKPYGSNRFCGISCACRHNISEAQKKKISLQVIRYWDQKGRKTKIPRKPKSILDLSTRTISKILHRSKQKCMICGWNDSTCDIHHIKPVSCGGTDENDNLIVVCPNCHRKIHTNKICILPGINIETLFKNWTSYYYVDLDELEKIIENNKLGDVS